MDLIRAAKAPKAQSARARLLLFIDPFWNSFQYCDLLLCCSLRKAHAELLYVCNCCHVCAVVKSVIAVGAQRPA